MSPRCLPATMAWNVGVMEDNGMSYDWDSGSSRGLGSKIVAAGFTENTANAANDPGHPFAWPAALMALRLCELRLPLSERLAADRRSLLRSKQRMVEPTML